MNTHMYTKQFAPAAERNKEPIAQTLSSFLPKRGTVLELASGTGQHAAHFARRFPNLRWQPSEQDSTSFESIEAYAAEVAEQNIAKPICLDVAADAWPIGTVDTLLAINLIHISPWTVTEGLFRGAAAHLSMEGLVITYGPYQVFGHHLAQSNQRFHQELKLRNQSYGVRDLRQVAECAAAHRFALFALLPMPANNHVVVFKKV